MSRLCYSSDDEKWPLTPQASFDYQGVNPVLSLRSVFRPFVYGRAEPVPSSKGTVGVVTFVLVDSASPVMLHLDHRRPEEEREPRSSPRRPGIKE